jgi:hypothetical protein
MRRLAPFLLICVLAGCASTDSSGGQAGQAGGSTLPVVTDDPNTTVVASTEPAPADPSATDPSATDLSATDLPATDVPTADPPATDPAATQPPATEPATTGEATERTAVFYAGSGPDIAWVPLGWWDGTGWNEIAVTDDFRILPPPAPEIESVAVTSLDLPDGPSAVVSGLSLGPEQGYCVDDETGPLIPDAPVIPDTPVSLNYDAVAVTADWPLQPRDVRQVGLENPEYASIGAGFFEGTPTAAEGAVAQAVRVDLDGDGIEEVLVTYERITEPNFGAANDFTGVYVRYPSADGSVVDELLAGYVMEDPVDFPTVGRYTLAAVADLNGDGVMEVMIRERFWESGAMSVYALDDGRLVRVGGGGCGV